LQALKVVAELLNSQGDWGDVPDIVTFTMKAFYDLNQNIILNLNQGVSKKEVDRLLGTKASKSELNNCLSTKVNITDVSAAISEVASQLENKLDEETFDNAIRDKVTYDDLQFVAEKKVDVEDYYEMLKKIVRLFFIIDIGY
jgi:hypothetical protein